MSDSEGPGVPDSPEGSQALAARVPLTKLDPKYLNKPLTADAERRFLRGVNDDMRLYIEEQLRSVEYLIKAAEDMEDAFEGEGEAHKAETIMAQIDRDVRAILDLIANAGFERDELEALRKRVAAKEEVTHAYQTWQDDIKAAKADYAGRTTRQKYAQNKHYVDYRTRLHAIKHGPGAQPNLSALLPAEDGDDSDDELELGAATVNLRCPILYTEFTKPMKNSKCPHRVDFVAVREFWPGRTAKSCPTAGCSVVLSAADFTPDLALERQLAKDKARRQIRADDAAATGTGAGADAVEVDDEETLVVKPKAEPFALDSDDE